MLDAEGLTMQTITLFVHVAFENAKFVRSSCIVLYSVGA